MQTVWWTGTILDKVVPALFLAAISALTFLAYKHPRAYQKMFRLLSVCYIAIVVSALAWHLGVFAVGKAMFSYIEADKLKEAEALASNYLIAPWMLPTALAVYVYLAGLLWLPLLLNEDKPPRNK
jgi:hypothetical protein